MSKPGCGQKQLPKGARSLTVEDKVSRIGQLTKLVLKNLSILFLVLDFAVFQLAALCLRASWLNLEAAHMNVFLKFMDLLEEARIMRSGGGLMGTSSVESGFSGSADACRRRAFSQERRIKA